ncbi:MAG: DUF1351 domain-containing protein [Endomicrobium sp.]|jgi:hypothetical protein|nr:DUF1351 domain-containing protein [Endomicrobium sp.]
MEFKLVIPTSEAAFLKTLIFNKEELIAELKNRIEKYKGITYDESQLKLAKEDRADLNKFKKLLDDERKRIKNKILEPYNKFEADIKEVIAVIDEPLNVIDAQVKGFELQKEEEKRNQIKLIYDAHIKELVTILPIEKIFNEKWLNATYSIANVRAEVAEKIEYFRKGLKIISELALAKDIETAVKDKFIVTCDINVALAEKVRLEAQKEKLAKIETAPAAEKKTAAALNLQTPAPADTATPRIYELRFKVSATAEQLAALKQFLVSNKINYERI